MTLGARLKRLEQADQAYWDRQIEAVLRVVEARMDAGDPAMKAAVQRAMAEGLTPEEGLRAVDAVLALAAGEPGIHPAAETAVRDRLNRLADEVRAMSDRQLLDFLAACERRRRPPD